MRLSAHSIGTKASSVYLSFVASQVWFSSHSIETKFSLDSWSVFLHDGVTLFRSDSTDMISIEGITYIWALGSIFPVRPRGDFLSSWGRPVCSEVGGEFHIQLSSLLVQTLCVSLSPTKEWGLALLLLALLLFSLPSRVDLLRQSSGDSFRQGVSCAGIPRMLAR